MNRRRFLLSGGTTAIATTMGLRTRIATGQTGTGLNPDVANAAGTCHSIAAGGATYGGATASEWLNVHNTTANLLTDWQNKGMDSYLKPLISRVNPASITAANVNQQSVLASIQLYTPQMQLVDVQRACNFVDVQHSQVSSVLAGLQYNGMANYLGSVSAQALKISQLLTRTGGSATALSQYGTNVRPPPEPPGGGGGGYSCAADGAAIFFAGLAFAVIGVMSWGAAPILVGAFWGGTAFIGGTGVAAWGIGHNVAGCGF